MNPTGTQSENDLARMGQTVMAKTPDGSPLDPNTPPHLRTAPKVNVAPAVTGTAAVGQVLTCSNGTWLSVDTPTYTKQWRRDAADIAGATANTYTVVAADSTHKISCRVTATNTKGSTSATTAQTATVP